MFEQLVSQLASGPTLLAAESANWVNSLLTGVQGAVPAAHRDAMFAPQASSGDDDFWPEDDDDWMAFYRPYNVANGILTIPVRGVLVNNFGWAIGDWITGYTYLAKAFDRGMDDPQVRGIVFDIDSPGGEVSGNFDLVDAMYARRGEKPVRAFANDAAYSAAYSIASAADSITVDRTGGVGSIGVITWHADYSKMLEKTGIQMTPIFAGAHKTDGNPYQALPDSVKNRMQERIDSLYAIFVQTVARNRGMDEQAVRDTEALTFGAQEAIEKGLADATGSFTEGVAAFANELAPTSGGYTMSTKTDDTNAQLEAATAAAKAEGVKEGAAAERTRIKAILEHENAQGRSAAAANIALTTDLSVDQATTLLGTLPAEAAKAESAQTEAADPVTSAFEQAMNRGGNPDVGALGGEGGKPSAKDQLLADYAAAGGPRKTK